MDVPQTFASQILTELVHAGLATSKAGRGGGYRLASPPESISLLQVVEAGEGPLRAERCALGDGPCRWDTVCPLHETWGAATAALRDTLAKTNLATLVARDIAIEQGVYPIPADAHRHSSPFVDIDDWVHVEAPVEAVATQLERVDSWLLPHVKSAYAQAEMLRQQIDPSGLTWTAPSISIVIVATCTPSTNERVSLTWDAGGARGPSSRFEGELELIEIDAERTELHMRGHFRPPLSIASSDPALAERLSKATVRSALREIAHVIETSASNLIPATTA